MQGSRKNETVHSSSFVKRRSLKGISDTFEDLPQNDDEAERKQRKRDSGVYANLALKRVSLGGITDLTTSEIVAQYANCMRLCAENKINHKNAFNLPLIDCMKLLLKNKDEKMENFQVVGCTLDASAKIYGSRVDRVHMDGISFAKGLGSRSRNLPASQRGGSDDELDEEENVPQKKKRGKKAPKLSRDVNKINLPENVNLQDPTFVVLSKQFSNCQPSFISFFPKLKLVGDNCKIILDMNAPFLADPIESNYGNEMVPFECDADENAELISLPYKNILSRDLDDTDYNSLLNTSVLDDSFDVRDDVENNFNMPDDLINDEAIGNGLLEGYSVAKNSSSWKEGCEIELEATRAGCVARNGLHEKVVDVEEAILKHVKEGRNLDYLYTNLDRMLWAGPTHWHSLPCSKVRDKICAMSSNLKRKEKKLSKMEFSNPETIKLPVVRCASLTTQYIENKWSADQVTNPPDLHIDIKILTRFFLRANCGFIYSSGKMPMPPEDEDVHDYDYNNLNDSQHFCPAASPGPTSDGDNSGNKDLPGFEEGREPAADVHSYETAAGDAWCMVDPPTKVARIHVPYAQHAKKIDMKVLKSAIWKVLCEDSGTDSVGDADLTPRKKMKNDKLKSKVDPAPLTSMTKEIKFSELEQKVLKIVPSDMAQELSMPLVFTALLHLANERVLSLRGVDDHSDIFISQDRGADSFVRRLQERQFK